MAAPRINLRRLAASTTLALLLGNASAQEPTVRSTAVVDLNFDEKEGPAEDRATAGTAKDAAQPMNAPARVDSPFWNASQGKAVRLDAAKTQFFQIPDSADLDHLAGTTLSFYYLGLHDPADATFRGIVAKREPTDASRTNYGLNFQSSSGRLQLYINDGAGYKVVAYPVSEAFGVRRLAHLTATFRPGDAPEPDADTDADDLEIRLFLNGKPLKPSDAVGGVALADSGWVTDVKSEGMLSDTPLTIGASYPNGEPVSAIFDEFLLFNRALSVDEAAKLFVEVAGNDGERLAKLELEAAPSVTPVVKAVVPWGVQVGATTRLTLSGENLGPDPALSLPGIDATVSILPDSTPQRLTVDVNLPSDAVPSLIPLAVRTPSGVSVPVPLPVDRLPQRKMADSENAARLPAAFTGTLKGADRSRLTFDGKAGELFVAEVELRRLGGKADPVLELKRDDTPVDIAWGRRERGGDPRLVTKLPADGRYVLELHDLAYQAPSSRFRLLAGDLRLIDAVIPSSLGAGGTREAIAVGVGIDGQQLGLTSASGDPVARLDGSAATAAHDTLPAVPMSDGRELTESEAAAEPIDLTGPSPVYVTGQLLKSGEADRFILRVRPGQAIDVRADSAPFGSPIEPVVTVKEGDRELAKKAAASGSPDVFLAATPSTEAELLEVRVADRLRGAGPGQLYRLRFAPAGTADCTVTCLDPSVTLPTSGRGVTRLRIERSGNAGTVKLVPDEASGVIIEPSAFPPIADEDANSESGNEGKADDGEEVFVTLVAAEGRRPGQWLSFTAEVETPNGPLRRPVRFSPGASVEQFDASRPYYRVPIVTSASAPSLDLVQAPEAAFKGLSDSLRLKLTGTIPEGHVARLTLVSDEPARPNDPAKPARRNRPQPPAEGTKPQVRLSDDALLRADAANAAIPLLIPADVAPGEIRAVVKAEIVPHIYSDRVAAVGYSSPFLLALKDAIAAVEPVGPMNVKAGEYRQLRVSVKRHPEFARPLRLELRGLPKGYESLPIDLPADQSEAAFTVSVPAKTRAGRIPDVELAITAADTLVKSLKPFPIDILP